MISVSLEFLTILDQWRGSRARVWRYHASLSRLVVCLRHPDKAVFLFVLAAGCQHVQGPFGWDSCSFEAAEIVDSHGLPLLELRDPGAGFKLECSSILTYVKDSGEFELD